MRSVFSKQLPILRCCDREQNAYKTSALQKFAALKLFLLVEDQRHSLISHVFADELSTLIYGNCYS